MVGEMRSVGCDGRGLAEGVAKKLPYGCSYAARRRMPPQNKFAVPEDRGVLGTPVYMRPYTTVYMHPHSTHAARRPQF